MSTAVSSDDCFIEKKEDKGHAFTENHSYQHRLQERWS